SRSITRPLRSLTGQATAMADHRLPEAVLDILDTPLDRKSTRLNSSHTVIYTLSLHDALPILSRSITRPLRSLTGQATAMADHRLPEAVLDILDTPPGGDGEVPEVDTGGG